MVVIKSENWNLKLKNKLSFISLGHKLRYLMVHIYYIVCACAVNAA